MIGPSELLADRLAAIRTNLADVLRDRAAPLGHEWPGQATWTDRMPTVGAAFDALERDGAELVDAMVADVEAAAEAFDLAAEVATLAALWPWPRMFAPEGSLAAGALWLLQAQARTNGEAPPPPMTMGRIGELVPSMGHRMSHDDAEIDVLGFSWTVPALGLRAVSAHALACARHPGEVIARWADDWRHRRDPAAEHLLTAAAVLRVEGANEDATRRHLAGELADELRGLGERMAKPGADPVELARAALAAIGGTGADLADRVERWRLVAAWHPTVGLCALLATALWDDRVKPALAAAAKRAATHRPALVRAVVADLMVPAMTRQLDLLDADVLRDKQGREVGRVALVDGATVEGVRRGLDRLGSVYGHRLIRTLVLRAHAQAEAGDTDARRVAFEGGWSALAEALGHNRDFTALRDLLEAGASVRWDTPTANGAGWWTFTERRGSRAGPGEIAFIVGEVLAPHYAMALAERGADSLRARVARRLVPELRAEPPVSALRSNDHGAAWNLHRLLLVELVDKAEALHLRGAVPIADRRWAELAKQAGVPAGNLPRLLDSWRTGDDAAPALLAEPDAGAFTLADEHKPERDFIADGGRRRHEGRLNGLAGKAKKARQRRKRSDQGKP